MKRPSTLYAGEVLRLTKNFFSPLNNINPKKWTAENYKEWNRILGIEPEPVLKSVTDNRIISIPKVHKKKSYENSGKPNVKVIRVSDGHVFDSISDCMRKENIYKVLMRNHLDEGTKYKRL